MSFYFIFTDYIIKPVVIFMGIAKNFHVVSVIDDNETKIFSHIQGNNFSRDKKGINQQTLNELPTKDSLIENLKTIPSVSERTIAAVISECEDLKKFPSIPKFIAYLGLFPTENSSGNSKSIRASF